MTKLVKEKNKLTLDLRDATPAEVKSFTKIVLNLSKAFGTKEYRLIVKSFEKISSF